MACPCWTWRGAAVLAMICATDIAGCGLSEGQSPLDAGRVIDAALVDVTVDAGSRDARIDGPDFEGAPSDGARGGLDAPSDAPADASSCDASLASDPTNCGACGHDCRGGACQAGRCQPVALASAQGSPQGLAIDAANVYWTNTTGGTVMQCPLAGCSGAPLQLASLQASPNSIAVGAGAVYWTSFTAGTVMTCPIGGGAVQTFASVPNPPAHQMGRVTTYGSTVYFTDATGGQVLSCPASGCGGGPTAIAVGLTFPFGIAANANHVFWVDYSAGLVQSCPASGCGGAPATMVNAQMSPRSIVIDDTGVYWAELVMAGSVRACPLAGCSTPTTFATGQNNPQGVAVDAERVYWTDNGDGTIWGAPKTGGSPVQLAGGQQSPWAIAVDATNIYWTNEVPGGAVMRLAK